MVFIGFSLEVNNQVYLTKRAVAREKTTEWVDWMLDVTTECLRVCRGPVVWVVAGPTRGRNHGKDGLNERPEVYRL